LSSLIPDSYVTIIGDHLEHAFEDQIGQTVEVLDRLPQPTDTNGSVFVEIDHWEPAEYHIGSQAPLLGRYTGRVYIFSKHLLEGEGKSFNRMLTTHLRHFLAFTPVLLAKLSVPKDELVTGTEFFQRFKLVSQDNYTSMQFKSNVHVQVSSTEFEIETETTCNA